MDWIYLSPHFDDVAFSCAGLIWKQVQAQNKVAVWTICGGDPPSGPLSSFARSLHERWGISGNAVIQRRLEDVSACHRMGASWRHFDIPDCIYRRSPHDGSPLYASGAELFGSIHPDEQDLINHLSQRLAKTLPSEAKVVSPLTVGGHVDHRLTQAAVERLDIDPWYYADFPYVQMQSNRLDQEIWSVVDIDIDKKTPGLQAQRFHLSETALQVWMEAAAAHGSQISSFWNDEDAMKLSIRDYYQQMEAMLLWRKI